MWQGRTQGVGGAQAPPPEIFLKYLQRGKIKGKMKEKMKKIDKFSIKEPTIHLTS